MNDLLQKFLATPPGKRRARVQRFVRDRTLHPALLAAKRIYYGDFYLQWRPAAEVAHGKLTAARAILDAWYETVGLGSDLARVYHLVLNISALDERGIDGDFAEIGVYRGDTARILVKLAGARRVYLMDTFEGFDPSDVETERLAGREAPREDFSDTSVAKVRALVGGDENVVICKGRFPATATSIDPDRRFALLHYDADLYEPAKSACEFFYPRMSPGGLMIFHNYADPGYPGCKAAVDEFFSRKPESVVVMPDQFGSGVVVRSKEATP